MRPALARLVVLGALLLSLVPGSGPASADLDPLALTATTPAVDATATAQLRGAATTLRHNAGLTALYQRDLYMSAAKRIATALVNDETFAPTSDGAPYVHVSGTTWDYPAVNDAVLSAVNSAGAVLRYPMHTDGGWSVVTARRLGGQISYAVVLVVGWPAPAVSPSRGCDAGYCWSNAGLNPHLPWTRNTVRWYLATSNLPANGEALVKASIAKLNAVSGVGAHLVYGGRTAATAPTATRRFVVVFGSGCSTPDALGCAITTTQGTSRMIFQARTIMMLSRYRANPSPTHWIGTLMHEMAHSMGLGHFDSAYNGSYQLMRSSGGPDELHLGDRNGLRRVAPAGWVSASLTPRTSGTSYALVVRTANNGLGGIRAIRTQCKDASGVWRTVRLVVGNFDGIPTERTVGWYAPPTGTGRYCQAIVRSKSRVVTTAPVYVRG